jgi:hypothetical protein
MVSGLRVPFAITIFRRGAPIAIALISSVSFNVAIDPSEFDLPVGGVE